MEEPPPVARVLVVDDAEEIRAILDSTLRREGFAVRTAASGSEGLAAVREFAPDLVVLDLTLPDLDGVEVCRRLRAISDAYVVMLSARSEEVDKLAGLSVGADDYVTKPFSPREVVARLRAMLRRPRAGAAASGPAGDRVVHRVGALEVDELAHEARVEGREVALTRIEFAILATLAGAPNVAFSRDQLMERVWGPGWFGDPHVVDVHVSKLRRKLEPEPAAPRYVRTVRGVGYRLGPG
ncbi:MAG TPA: response regulator transcription factor [Capillimicrobium sp.]|jgi:DNA-binding response OmpR family regulator